jgi:signal transduction histidine kinase
MSARNRTSVGEKAVGSWGPASPSSSLFSRYSTGLSLALVFFVIAIAGTFVIHDVRSAGVEVQKMYEESVLGLHRIGDLQYAAQETRRSTFYALSTKDSNLHVKYADQSREADHLVTEGIAQYLREADTPSELAVGKKLESDWSAYLRVRDEVLASILEGSEKAAVALDLKDGVPLFDNVRADLEEIDRLYDEQASVRLANVAASSRRTMFRLVAVLGIALVFAIGSVWVIQRIRMQGALQVAKLQMEFVASVSHELRTPLAVISSAADNIADGIVKGPDEQRKYGVALQNQSRQMTELVNQILLFAATVDSRNPYVLRPVRVSKLIDSALQAISEPLKSSGFTVDLQFEPDLPPVMGDPSALSQCLQNLIGNALKYSGQRRWIGIKASLRNSERGAGREIRIAVQDHGIGIDPAELSRVFDPFYRSPAVKAEQIHGTGLGLAVARNIVEAMGGTLNATSELGVGSTFTLHLPVPDAADVSGPAEISEQDKASQR